MKPKLNFVFQVDVHSARNGYLTPNAKAVMLVYRSYAGKTGEASPSQARIRKHTRLSLPTIRRCIIELTDHHILVFLRAAEKGKHGDVYLVANAKQLSTSTYHSGTEDNYSPDPSFSGIARSQYEYLETKGCFEQREPTEPENIEF